MRTSPVLDALFPRVRARLLGAVYMQTERWWYLSELAHFLKLRPSTLQRELEALAEAGILEQRREGRRVYVKANSNSPVFDELRSLLHKTAGIVPILQSTLKEFHNQIQCAFVYGSIARKQEHSGSDVDLMIIGEIGLADILPVIRTVERQLGRDLNVTNYSPEEFRQKTRNKDHFLERVLKGPKNFIIGNQRDLERIAHPKGSTAA